MWSKRDQELLYNSPYLQSVPVTYSIVCGICLCYTDVYCNPCKHRLVRNPERFNLPTGKIILCYYLVWYYLINLLNVTDTMLHSRCCITPWASITLLHVHGCVELMDVLKLNVLVSCSEEPELWHYRISNLARFFKMECRVKNTGSWSCISVLQWR